MGTMYKVRVFNKDFLILNLSDHRTPLLAPSFHLITRLLTRGDELALGPRVVGPAAS